MSQQWIIVFPRGDKSKLDLALAWDYEFDQYDRASRHSWTYEDKETARCYGLKLLNEHPTISGVGDLRGDSFLD